MSPTPISAQEQHAEYTADELAERGLVGAQLIYRDTGQNVYLVKENLGEVTLAAVHRLEDEAEPIIPVVAVQSPYPEAYNYAPELLARFQRNLLPILSARVANLAHVRIDHYARGFHRMEEKSLKRELPMITTSYQLASSVTLRGVAYQWEHYPAMRIDNPNVIIGQGYDQLRIDSARNADQKLSAAYAARTEARRKEKEAEQLAERANAQRREAEHQQAATAAAQRGLRIDGVLDWSAYRHGDIIRGILRGEFADYPTASKDFQLLFVSYVENFAVTCSSYLPARTTPISFSTTITALNPYGMVLDYTVRPNGVKLIDSRFADLYVAYYNSPTPAFESLINYAQGKDVVGDLVGWATDINLFFGVEDCQGTTMLQLGENLLRHAERRSSLQTESNPADVIAASRVPVSATIRQQDEQTRASRLAAHLAEVQARTRFHADLMPACNRTYPAYFCTCAIDYVRPRADQALVDALRRNFYEGLGMLFQRSQLHRVAVADCDDQ